MIVTLVIDTDSYLCFCGGGQALHGVLEELQLALETAPWPCTYVEQSSMYMWLHN